MEEILFFFLLAMLSNTKHTLLHCSAPASVTDTKEGISPEPGPSSGCVVLASAKCTVSSFIFATGIPLVHSTVKLEMSLI